MSAAEGLRRGSLCHVHPVRRFFLILLNLIFNKPKTRQGHRIRKGGRDVNEIK